MFGNLQKYASEGFHIVIAAYIVLGWLLSPVIHAPVCFGIIIHWLLNNGRCMMSEGYEDSNGFSSGLMKKVGIDITNNETLKKIVPYLLVLIPGLFSVFLAIKCVEFVPQIVKTVTTHLAMITPIGLSLQKIISAAGLGVMEGLKTQTPAADAVTATETSVITE